MENETDTETHAEIDALPDELLVYCFRRVGWRERLDVVGHACRRWESCAWTAVLDHDDEVVIKRLLVSALSSRRMGRLGALLEGPARRHPSVVGTRLMACAVAVTDGDMYAIETLRKANCPWDSWTSLIMGAVGSVRDLESLVARGCPTRGAFVAAMALGRIDVLQVFYKLGGDRILWTPDVARIAPPETARWMRMRHRLYDAPDAPRYAASRLAKAILDGMPHLGDALDVKRDPHQMARFCLALQAKEQEEERAFCQQRDAVRDSGFLVYLERDIVL